MVKWKCFLLSIYLSGLSFLAMSQNISFGGKLSIGTTFIHLDESEAGIYNTSEKSSVSTGMAQILMTVNGESSIRAYFGGTFSGVSLTNLETGITVPTLNENTLDKAYTKIRLSWLSGRTARLSIGKMPISWGYGTVFNAGDIIFGPEPKSLTSTGFSLSGGSSEAALSDLRSSTDWIADLSIPVIDERLMIEPVVVFPLTSGTDAALSETDKLYSVLTGSDTTIRPRIGGRILFTPYLERIETVEAGYLTNYIASEQQFYVAVDGNLFFDYNLCTTASFFRDSLEFTTKFGEEETYTAIEQTEQSAAISFGLSKIIAIPNYESGINNSLSLKVESLWYPFSENLKIFALAYFSCTETVSVALTYMFVHTEIDSFSGKAKIKNYTTYGMDFSGDNTHVLAFNLSVLPVKNMEFDLTAALPDLLRPAEIDEIAISCVYRF